MGVGPAHFASLPFLPVSTWPYILSYSTYVQLDKFSCDFGVVVGGGEYSLTYSAILNRKPINI